MSQSRKSNKQNGSIQSFGIWLLEFLVYVFVPERVREEFVGDLLEEWSSGVVPQRGKLKGLFWLCSQLLRSLIPMETFQNPRSSTDWQASCMLV
jgi:hypothetical protein